MAIIPDMDLEAAQSALNSNIRRKIDDDLKHNLCLWCKSGSGKKKKHPLIDCPNARPPLDSRTAFSNEVFNTGQGDAAIAYIHHLQLRQYPRSDGATTFLAGRHRAQMAMFVRPVATQAPQAPAPPVNTPTVPVPPASTASTEATTSTPATVDGVPSTLPTAMNSLSLGNPTHAPSATSQPITSASVPNVPIKDSPQISWTNHVPYDRATNAPPPAAYGTGNQFNPGTGVIKKIAPLKNKMKHPVRDRLNDDKRHSVLTNHFEVAIDPKAKFYEYRIVGIPESEKRATKKRIMDTVIDNVPFLRNNQASFASDYVDTIIAWKDIHSLVTGPKVGSYDPMIQDSREEWRILEVVDRNVTLYLNLRLIGLVGIEQFQRYIASEHSNPPAYDPEPAKNALNIIFTKCFGSSPSVRQLNSHKFYVTDALMDMKTFRDQMWPLRALRGYYYTIKAGMGKILLNVSTANSLFWNPETVSDVLNHGLGTFGGDRYALKGVQVYIRYDRGKNAEARSSDLNARHNRVKKIRGFGKALNVQEFDLHTKDAQGNITGTRRTTVADYLERSKWMP
jgi:eukaryotic translation initiation factor 2C